MLKGILATPARKKLALLLAVTLVAALLFVVAGRLATPSPSDPEKGPRDRSFEVGIPTIEKVEAFVQGYGSRVESTEAELARLREELEGTRKELRDSVAELARSRSEDTSLLKSLVQDLKNSTSSDGNRHPASGAARVKKFEFTLTGDQAKGPRKKALHIPAGSFGEITLLTGIYAPVAGEALPIHARLDVALVGPNGTRLPLEGAFLIGRVQGDPNGCRAVIQFQKLAFVMPGGETLEVAINADVADADGVLGLAGRYVWRADEILTLAGFSGGASGAADALAARQLLTQLSPFGGGTSIVTGDPVKFAGTRGASKGLERISEIVAKRLEEITPAVYVPNGKKATILFIEGVTLERLAIDEVKHGASSNPYGGLDFDR